VPRRDEDVLDLETRDQAQKRTIDQLNGVPPPEDTAVAKKMEKQQEASLKNAKDHQATALAPSHLLHYTPLFPSHLLSQPIALLHTECGSADAALIPRACLEAAVERDYIQDLQTIRDIKVCSPVLCM
jgi:hypothetical protein